MALLSTTKILSHVCWNTVSFSQYNFPHFYVSFSQQQPELHEYHALVVVELKKETLQHR
jgi:hypothetical protein